MGQPFPSTYKQVVENMKRLNEIIDNYVSKLVATIFNPTAWADGSTDIKYDPTDDKLKVIGETVLTSNPTANSGPSEYFRNITYELKNSASIGLSDLPGIGTVVTLMTVNVPDGTCWQVAYSDDRMTTYFRKANTDMATWTAWESVGRKQFVESVNQPGDNEQDIGDYWMKPIDDGQQLYRKTGDNIYTQVMLETTDKVVLVQESNKSLETKLGEIDTATSEINHRIDDLSDSVDERFSEFNENLTAVDDRETEHYTTVTQNIASINSAIATTNVNLSTLDTREANHYIELSGRISTNTTNIENLRNDIINGTIGAAVHVGATAPSNTKCLWIDTSSSTNGGLKYHNGSAWVHVPVAYA